VQALQHAWLLLQLARLLVIHMVSKGMHHPLKAAQERPTGMHVVYTVRLHSNTQHLLNHWQLICAANTTAAAAAVADAAALLLNANSELAETRCRRFQLHSLSLSAAAPAVAVAHQLMYGTSVLRQVRQPAACCAGTAAAKLASVDAQQCSVATYLGGPDLPVPECLCDQRANQRLALVCWPA
jgi:hypothetical protein